MDDKELQKILDDMQEELDDLRKRREEESAKLENMTEDEMVEYLTNQYRDVAKHAEEIGMPTVKLPLEEDSDSEDEDFSGIPELSEDEFADDDIVTLIGADGEQIDFVEIAGIAHKGHFYAILQPVELIDGMSDDEALVFKVTRGENGEDKFEIELDDEIINAVFAEYNRLLDNCNAVGDQADEDDGDE